MALETPPPPSPLAYLQSATRERAGRLLEALKQAPLEIVLSLCLAVTFCLVIQIAPSDEHESLELLARCLALLYPVTVATFATTILHRFKLISTPARWGLSALYLASAVVYLVVRFDPDLYESELWRWFTISFGVTAAFGLVALIVARRRGFDARAYFATFNSQIAVHIALSAAFSLAMMLGVFFAMGAADELLGVDFKDERYAQVAALIWGVLPWQVTTILPKLHAKPAPTTRAVRATLRALCTYLFLPLMGLYMGILYLYQGRLLLGVIEAPKNMMSPLVLVAAALLLCGMLLADQLEPAPEELEREGAERPLFLKVSAWLPALFLPLMPMSVWAVWIRIEQYGFTEFRYLRLLLLAVLCAVFVLATYNRFKGKAQPLLAIIAIFGASSLLASFGPLSAQAVSQRSQYARLVTMLEEQGHLTERGVLAVAEHDMSPFDSQSARVFDYLLNQHGIDSVEPLIDRVLYAELVKAGDGQPIHSYDVLKKHHYVIDYGYAVEVGRESKTVVAQDMERGAFIPHAGRLHKVEIYNAGNSIPLIHQGCSLELEERGVRLDCSGDGLADEYEGSVNLGGLVGRVVVRRDEVAPNSVELSKYVPQEMRALAFPPRAGESVSPASFVVSSIVLREESEAWVIAHIEGYLVQRGD